MVIARAPRERIYLGIEEAGVSRKACQLGKAPGRSLHHETAVIKQKSAQPGKFFSPSGSTRATMQAAGNHVAMAGVLIADRRVDDKNSTVQVPDSEHNTLS